MGKQESPEAKRTRRKRVDKRSSIRSPLLFSFIARQIFMGKRESPEAKRTRRKRVDKRNSIRSPLLFSFNTTQIFMGIQESLVPISLPLFLLPSLSLSLIKIDKNGFASWMRLAGKDITVLYFFRLQRIVIIHYYFTG